MYDNTIPNTSYFGVFNEDPKIIAKKLKRPKTPIQSYNLSKSCKVTSSLNVSNK